MKKLKYIAGKHPTEEEDQLIYDEDWESILQQQLLRKDATASQPPVDAVDDVSSSSSSSDLRNSTLLEMKNRHLLEMYVLGKSEWPMQDDSPRDVDSNYYWFRRSDDELRAQFKNASDVDIAFFEAVLFDGLPCYLHVSDGHDEDDCGDYIPDEFLQDGGDGDPDHGGSGSGAGLA